MKNSTRLLNCVSVIILCCFFQFAKAQIVYTDVNPDQTFGTNGGTYNLDLNNDGTTDFSLTLNTYVHGGVGCSGTKTDYTISITSEVNNAVVVDTILNNLYAAELGQGNAFYAISFNGGEHTLAHSYWWCHLVNFNWWWSHILWGDWVTGSTDKYLGLRINVNGSNYYGWARLNVAVYGSSFTIKDYAYNTIPDETILAGQTCPPQVVIAANGPTAFCEGDSLMLTANTGLCNASSLLWSTGETTSGIIVNSSGTYSVTLTDTSGNSTSDSISVSIFLPDEVTITPDGPTTFCFGDDVVLTDTTNQWNYFLWSTGEQIHHITVNAGGIYVLTVTDAQGCSNFDSITITVLPLSEPGIIESSNELCTETYFFYQWKLDSAAISGATDQCFFPIQSGNYAVEITDSNGCLGTSSEHNFTLSGLKNIVWENQFVIYPNPASDKISLSFSSSEKKEIQITNTLGQIVFAEKITSTTKYIDVSEFPEGMYVVSAQTFSQKVEEKFLKQ